MSDSCGPGYASPDAAMKEGPREKILYVNCARHADSGQPNFLATVDVDPDSTTYGQIINQLNLLHVGDEVHRSGWNACSSCYGRSHACRSHIVIPCVNSSRIYIINTKDNSKPFIEKVIEPNELLKLGVSFPHTSHCLADGNIMVSTVGDEHGQNKGSFIMIDGKTFTPTGLWSQDTAQFGSDFWYQPRWNVMIGGSWGHPEKIKTGFNLHDYKNGHYGSLLSVWDWQKQTKLQSLDMGQEFGAITLELRFLHNPDSPIGFATATIGSTIFRFCPEDPNATKPSPGSPPPRYKGHPVIKLPRNKANPQMPPFVSTIVISMDDRFLYCSSWFHGTVRQYDIADTAKPKLVGQVSVGGLVSPLDDFERPKEAGPRIESIKGRKIEGGPQMLQLSLDGKRLYVTTSLYSIWDKQFYPGMVKNGAVMFQIDVNTENGGLSVNKDFLVDFGKANGGPSLANEMRIPGGDCTSDIWI